MHLLKGRFSTKNYFFAVALVLCCMLPMGVKAARATYSLATYRLWSKLPTDTLMNRGRAYLAQETRIDSALICYTVVVQRYKEGQGNRAERYQYAKALNNLGFMFAGHYMDFEKAYYYLMESKRISLNEKFSENLPYVYMNLASMYENRSSLFGISDPNHDAFKSMRLAFRSAVSERQWMVAYTCFTNLLTMVAGSQSLSSIKAETKTFQAVYSQHPLPMGEYAFCMMQWQEAYNRGDATKALYYCRKMGTLVGKVPDIGTDCELIVLWKTAKTYMRMGDYAQTQNTLTTLAAFIDRNDMENEKVNLYGIYRELYQKMGNKELERKYDYLYLKEKDTFFHLSNVEKMERAHFVNEINRVNDELVRIETRRRTLIITLSVVVFVLLIIIVATTVIVRGFFRQREYIKILYEKNLALAKAGKVEAIEEKKALPLDEERTDALCRQIDAALRDTELICSLDFSLQQLADKIGSNYKYVSQVINERYQKNFRQLLNEARVKEACLRLDDPEHYGNLTIEAIATSLGFKSRSNFTVTFKKITGISPSDFQKMAKQRDTSDDASEA